MVAEIRDEHKLVLFLVIIKRGKRISYSRSDTGIYRRKLLVYSGIA